jgi:hypothetical protein
VLVATNEGFYFVLETAGVCSEITHICEDDQVGSKEPLLAALSL